MNSTTITFDKRNINITCKDLENLVVPSPMVMKNDSGKESLSVHRKTIEQAINEVNKNPHKEFGSKWLEKLWREAITMENNY